jgi:hypothetical protein
MAHDVESRDSNLVQHVTDFLPNISAMATIHHGNHMSLSGQCCTLKADDRLKVVFNDVADVVRVLAIVDADTYVIDTTRYDQQQVFVYGKESPDFRTIDYTQMMAVSMGALQSLIKKVDDLEALVHSMRD